MIAIIKCKNFLQHYSLCLNFLHITIILIVQTKLLLDLYLLKLLDISPQSFFPRDYVQFLYFQHSPPYSKTRYVNLIGTLIVNKRLIESGEGSELRNDTIESAHLPSRATLLRETWTLLPFVSVPPWYCYKVVTS